ncbi:MAG: non-heme iron oxygenase ferredoxin subunit, partial [Actinomycetota bacterium]|nr:non-heme iron oxygenase ferredoxin subunit [Actinomycetota bacterium]
AVRHRRRRIVAAAVAPPARAQPELREARAPCGEMGRRYSRQGKSDPPARTYVPEIISVCPINELTPGEVRLVKWEDLEIGVFNCNGTILAIEDRCSHDEGPLVEGELDQEACTIECPRHGSLFDLRTGTPKTLPAYVAVDTFPVIIDDQTIKLEVD